MYQDEHDVWVDAIAKFHHQGHFERHKSDVWSVVGMRNVSQLVYSQISNVEIADIAQLNIICNDDA